MVQQVTNRFSLKTHMKQNKLWSSCAQELWWNQWMENWRVGRQQESYLSISQHGLKLKLHWPNCKNPYSMSPETIRVISGCLNPWMTYEYRIKAWTKGYCYYGSIRWRSRKIEKLKKKPKSREARIRFTVDMSERMHAKLRVLSADKNARMTKLVRMAVAELIARLEED